MTLTGFVTKSAFRNKRRSTLTVLSIAFSLLLLTLMMTIWHGFYIDKGSAQVAQRLITRHRVSLTESMPVYYREKIRTIPGVVAVAPTNWFGGLYIDDKPENFFAQFGTDPEEIFKVATDFKIPDDQLAAWQRDQAGCVVDSELAKNMAGKSEIASFSKEPSSRSISNSPFAASSPRPSPASRFTTTRSMSRKQLHSPRGAPALLTSWPILPMTFPRSRPLLITCSAILPNPRRPKVRRRFSSPLLIAWAM